MEDSPFLDDVSGLVKGSHKQVRARCQARASDKCKGEIVSEYRAIRKWMDGNNGKYFCLYCSRALKFTGRENPNCRYKNIDDNFFNQIDTEEKAYLMGWIASDGTVRVDSIRVEIHDKDRVCLESLRDIFCCEIPVKQRKDRVYFTISSKQCAHDVCKHLCIEPGKKSDTVRFPDHISVELKWAFLRGYFEGDGHVRNLNSTTGHGRECQIASNSESMLESIGKFTCVKHHIYKDKISYTGVNATDFLSKIYDNSNPKLRLDRKYQRYLSYLGYAPGLLGQYGRIPRCKYVKTVHEAFPPTKNNASDEGYDLTLISVDKTISKNITRFDTGIKIQPEAGYHVEMLPRSSLSSSGYMLANSIGLIDESYAGTLKVTLIKVDQTLPDIKLPYKAVQIVLRKSNHFLCDEEEELEDTTRGDGGFGSTGKI